MHDIHDHGCMNGEVVESGSPVSFHSAQVPSGFTGSFSGPSGMTHLNVSIILFTSKQFLMKLSGISAVQIALHTSTCTRKVVDESKSVKYD